MVRSGLVVTGADGFLGSHLVRLARERGLDLVACQGPGGRVKGMPRLDLRRPGFADALLAGGSPTALIHLAAVSTIAGCAADPALARRVNRDAVEELARAAARREIPFVLASTDQIYDGRTPPYGPRDRPNPLSLYGATKAEAEERVRQAGGRWQIARLALLFGRSPDGERGASDSLLRAYREGGLHPLFVDEVRAPLAAAEAAAALLAIARQPAGGVWQVGSPRGISRYAFGRLVVAAAGLDPDRLPRGRRGQDPRFASRPRDLTLEVSATAALPGVRLSPPREALARIYGQG